MNDITYQQAPSRRLVVRENQASFQAAEALDVQDACLSARGDELLTHHVQATVDRLTDLVTDAVKASDDRKVEQIDRLLREAEKLLANAQDIEP